MPILSVSLGTRPSPQLAAGVASTLVELTSTILHKQPQVTSVAVQFIDPQHWFIAGRSLAELGKSTFFLDVRITDGTNTKDEKGQYVAEVFRAMSALLGEVHDESYVHVHDVRADAYGYGGLTQEHRYIRGRR
jgi:4-oxalocrotonate tautomerase